MKASGIALLTAAQLCGVLLLSGTALAANASGIWSGLWRTPDQQGQALLDAGEPAQAAQRFQDPRRRAYADLQSGGYSGAAKLLAPFTDPQSEYNRGNALAKSGQLQAALAAYDSALKQAPADEDIRHNRDLVERALQQQQQKESPQSSSHNGRQGNQGNQGSQASQGRQGKQGGQGGTSQGQQPRSSANGKQGSSGPQQSGSASQQSRAGGSQSPNSDQAASSGPQAGANANQAGNSSQEQREAAEAAALARAQRQRGAAGNTAQGRSSGQNGKAPGTDDNLLAGGSQIPKQKPETERQMALDQWLRQIPDSPAGLLRRKFLIEHMIRQQDSGGSPESAQ
jgi:Ca-activated chloride channel homolog